MKILLLSDGVERSNIVDELSKYLPTYQVVDIGEGSCDIEGILSSKNILIHMTSLGDFTDKLSHILKPKSYILLKLAGEKKCNTWQTQEGIKVESALTQNAIGVCDINDIFDIYSLPIAKYEYLTDTIVTLTDCPSISEVVLYGSIARREWLSHGDGDIMVITDMTSAEVQAMLERVEGVTFSDVLPDKVTLYFGDFLIEIAVVERVEDNELYYVNSYIPDPSYSIIKGGIDTLDRLIAMQKRFVVDTESLTKNTISRLVYFVLSMDCIAKSGNEYKFFFHSNIITHEIIRLSKQLQGEYKYDYLPKDSDSIFEAMQADGLVYSYVMDKQDYISRIHIATRKLLAKIDNIDERYIDII